MAIEESLGLADYLSAIRRRRKLGLAVGIPLLVGALVVAFALPSKYRSQAMFEMEEAKLASYMPAAGNAGRINQLDQYVASLSETALVDAKLGEAVDELHPYPELADDRAAAVAKMRSDIQIKMVKRKILDPYSGREREIISGFTVSYDHRDPEMALQGASWLSNAFAQANRERGRLGAASAAAFFSAEAERLRERIAADERRLADFKARNVGRLPDQTDMNLQLMDRSSSELDNVQTQIRILQRDRVFMLQQLAQAQANTGADNLREMEAEYARRLTSYDENHPDMISLRRQIDVLKSGGAVDAPSLQAQLESERAVLAGARQRYSEDHPDVKRLMRNVAALEARIAAGEGKDAATTSRRTPAIVQLQTQINATDTQIAGLEVQAASLRSKVGGFESRLVTSPEVEREYQEINRDLTGAREKYQQLTNQQRDAELSESAIAGGRGDEFRTVQSPRLPESPASPPRAAIAVLGLIAAILFSIISIFTAESVDPTVRSKHDLRRILGVATLAEVPEIRTAEFPVRERLQLMRFAGAVSIAGAALFVAIRAIA